MKGTTATRDNCSWLCSLPVIRIGSRFGSAARRHSFVGATVLRIARCTLFALIAAQLALPVSSAAAESIDVRPARTALAVEPVLVDDGRVIPDTGGPISQLLLHYNDVYDEQLSATYRDLFDALSLDVHLVVVCPSQEAVEQFVDQWAESASAGLRDVDIVDVDCGITIWARDRLIARELPGAPQSAAAVTPAGSPVYGDDKYNELTLADLFRDCGLLPHVMQSFLDLEGGNVVSSTRDIFVGANVYSENDRHDPGVVDLELRRVLGPNVIAVGGSQGLSPWAHVDMYLTPIDDEHVLVASPKLAHALLSAASRSHRSSKASVRILDSGDFSNYCQAQFDLVAFGLKNRGYTVHRVPAVVDFFGQWVLTYNNVLMENRDGHKVVYLPRYRTRELDGAAAAIYRRLGFEVIPIDMSRVFRWGGSLRCIANVMERGRGAHNNRRALAGKISVHSLYPDNPSETVDRWQDIRLARSKRTILEWGRVK